MFKIFNKKSSSPLDAYPVGSYYISSISTSPETLFGGTWERITNRFLWCADDNEIGSTGGERNHTLTINEMPSHTHSIYALEYNPSEKWLNVNSGNAWGRLNRNVSYTGGSQAHNNMPPYLGVYCWHRTA